MKLSFWVLLIVLAGFISGCGVYTLQNVKPADTQAFVGQDGGFLYGTYTFSDNSYLINANVSLVAGIEGKDDKEYYIDMWHEKGSFLYFLKPGTYKISLMQYKNYWGREIYDSQLMHSTFTILPNQITYLGSFTTVADYDKTFIHWGIKSVSDNGNVDIASIKKLDPALNDLVVLNETLNDAHSISDIRYTPNSNDHNTVRIVN